MFESKASIKAGIVLLAAALFITLFVSFISSFTLSGVDLSPNNATTSDNLICTWTLNDTATVNVTWYNGTQVYTIVAGATNPQTLDNSLTRRGEVWNCTVSAGNSTSSSVQSDTVTIVNANPTPVTIGNRTLYEDQAFSETLNASDADGDSLTYSCSPSGIVDTCSSAGLIEWTPAAADIGLYNITFLVTDDQDPPTFIGKKIVLNVTAVNDRPTFSGSISDTSIDEGEYLQYSVTVTDEENATGPFTFNANSSYYPPIEKLEYEIISSTNNTFMIQFINNRTAEFSDIGNYTVWIQACDPANSTLCVNDSFNLEVVTINHAPNLSLIPNATGTQNQNFLLYVNATDQETLDTLTFSVSTNGCDLTSPWSIATTNSSYNATGLINITSLNNSHIVCRNITISVSDTKVTTSQNVHLNLTNVNDAPVLRNFSFDSGNTQSNTDLRNLTAYTNVAFQYKINGTDVDLLIDSNENLTFRDNSSLCSGNCPFLNINSTSGIIGFVPNSSTVGNFTYEVNVTDAYGNSSSGILYLFVLNNSAPQFSPSLANQSGSEGVLFTYDINATDPENTTITFSDDSSLFVINSSTGLVNFSPSCSQIGVSNVTITITDSVGAQNTGVFVLNITNAPDAPVLPTVANQTIVEEFPFYLNVNASTTDADITCSLSDYLNFTSNFISGSTFFNITNEGVISFTPTTSNDGSYLINITVFDSYGLYDSLIWNLTVVNRTNPPVITNITPYGTPTNFSWVSPTIIGSNFTIVNFTENATTLFNHTSVDPDGNQLVYNWTVDGIVGGSSESLSRYWNFTNAGTHSVILTVVDNVSGVFANYVNFTWNVTVSNLNRPPLLNTSLPNVTVNGSLTLGNYLSGVGWGETRFNDPDNDTLTYNYTSNSAYVTIAVSDEDVTFTGVQTGNTSVIFTATDTSGEVVSSNNVTIIITQLPASQQSTTTTSDGGSSSSSSSSSTSFVPFSVVQEVEKQVQVYLDIIVPTPLTVYKNNTLSQLIKLVNEGNDTLRGVYISAVTNFSDAEITFSTDYFPELKPKETAETNMLVTAYKLLNNYEIIIWANVSNPGYRDKAVIYVNALEKTRGNESVTSTKITFAEDLLSSNPECIELNEFLKQARNFMDQKDYQSAAEIIDSVIQGCKYLVTESKIRDERPIGFLLNVNLDSNPFIKPILALVAIGLIAFSVMTIRAKRANDAMSKEG